MNEFSRHYSPAWLIQLKQLLKEMVLQNCDQWLFSFSFFLHDQYGLSPEAVVLCINLAFKRKCIICKNSPIKLKLIFSYLFRTIVIDTIVQCSPKQMEEKK